MDRGVARAPRDGEDVGRRQDPSDDGEEELRGRHEEAAALSSILVAIDSVRQPDGTYRPIRGAGSPQRREAEQK